MEGNNKAACEVLLQGEGTTSHWVHIEIATDDPQSEVCCVALVNITRRKETEMALRESEDKFKYVFEYSTIEKSLTLPSGEVRPNQALCNMLGYTQAKLQSKKWQDITHPDDIELTKEKSINSSPIHRVQQGLQKVYP